MRRSLYKDYKRRKEYAKNEISYLIYKAFACNKILPVRKRLTYFNLLDNARKNTSITRIRNRCLITGRGRGIIREYGLSRIELKRRIEAGLIPGMRKASW